MLKHEFHNSLKQLQCRKSAADSVQHVGQSSIPAVCLHAGDEVTISYFGDLSSHKDLRQRALGVAWHFACSCPRCTVEEALHSKLQSLIGYLVTEADKHGSHNPDRYSYSYRYSGSPAFFASSSYHSVKCENDTSFALTNTALLHLARPVVCHDAFCEQSLTRLLPLAVYDGLALQQQYCTCVYTVCAVHMHKHVNRFYSQDCCMALATGMRYRYLGFAMVFSEGLNILEERLCETDLPLKQQHWAMFSALEAYLCLWHCAEAMEDTQHLQPVRCKRSVLAVSENHLPFCVTAVVYMACKTSVPSKSYLLCCACMHMLLVFTFVFAMQLAKTISAIFISTQPFSAPHVNSMVRIFKCAARLVQVSHLFYVKL